MNTVVEMGIENRLPWHPRIMACCGGITVRAVAAAAGLGFAACGGQGSSDIAQVHVDGGAESPGTADESGESGETEAGLADPSDEPVDDDSKTGHMPDSDPPGSMQGAGGASSMDVPGADGGDAGKPPEEPPFIPDGSALPVELRGDPGDLRYVRLMHAQWYNSVINNVRNRSVVGVDALRPDSPTGMYSNDERALFVDEPLYEDYLLAAERIAADVAGTPAALERLYAGSDSEGFIAEVGLRFFRRPLGPDEIARYQQLFDIGSTLSSASSPFVGGAELVLQTFLQSPHFLYQTQTAADGELLNDYELASRLSFLLTDSTPSDALLEAAANGDFSDEDFVFSKADELLEETAAADVLERFFRETYSLQEFSATPAMNDSLEGSARLFFRRIYDDSLGLREILLSQVAFADAEIASAYDLEDPAGGAFGEFELGSERVGFFSQLPFLVRYSYDVNPNSIGRGAYLNERVLCGGLRAPDGVMGPIEADAALSNREMVLQAVAAPQCSVCHENYTLPLGFAFENFDGLGRLRDTDNGEAVITAGGYPFTEGYQTFAGAPELMTLMAEAWQAHFCHASHIAQFGLGRELSEADTALVEQLATSSRDEADSIKWTILHLVQTAAFRGRSGANP